MAGEFFRFPVPDNPPNSGDFITVQFNIEWLPIILALVETMKSPTQWIDPPDSIQGQVDELIVLLSTNLD